MDQERNFEEVVNTGNAHDQLSPTPPTVDIDMPSGLSVGSDSVFGSEVEERSEIDYDGNLAANDTAPFTEIQSAMLTVSKGAEFGSDLPAKANAAAATSDGPKAFMKYLSRRQAKPTMISRGTNVLMPLGGTPFVQSIGTSDITALNALASTTSAMNSLIAGVETPGNFRFVANWRRIFDLKNTVISYFNRSIPFTDLEASDRFAIEMCYIRDIASACLPLYAKAAAQGLIKYWTKLGYQFKVENFTNIQSQTLERLCKSIYSAVAALPCVDEIFFKRLDAFTKLHTTAKVNGFTPTIIMQDVAIGSPGRYKLSNVSANNGYLVSTDMGALSDAQALNGTTFMEWLEIWLRADIYGIDEAAGVLEQYLALAQSIRTNYSIMLACAMQLQTKGSVQYKTVGEFIPVSNVCDYTLEYEDRIPVFSYSYKERFEYAPRQVEGEYSNGTAAQFEFNLADLPDTATVRYKGNLFRRPIGLHKGSKAWSTKEIVDIGVFKHAVGLTNTNRFLSKELIAVIVGVSLVNIFTPSLSTGYEDAYYGDIYLNQMSHIERLSTGDTSGNIYRSAQELVSYYGLSGSAQNAPFANLSTYIYDGGVVSGSSIVDGLDIKNGTHILSFGDVNVEADATGIEQIYQSLIALLEAADLTFFMDQVKNSVGEIARPIFIFTGYRGAMWDDFDIAPINNAMANAMYSLTYSMRQNSKSKTVAK